MLIIAQNPTDVMSKAKITPAISENMEACDHMAPLLHEVGMSSSQDMYIIRPAVAPTTRPEAVPASPAAGYCFSPKNVLITFRRLSA